MTLKAANCIPPLRIESMARGFDSKFVEAQQEEAGRKEQLRPAMTPVQRQREAQRQSLQLAKARASADLLRATVPAHRRMLEEALKTVEAQLEQLQSRTSREVAGPERET